MVKYQKKNLYSQWKKSKYYMVDEDEESALDPLALICGNCAWSTKRAKPKIFYYFILISLVCCCFILAPLLFSFCYSNDEGHGSENGYLCSSVPNGTICCDRRSRRSDICVLKGDVRTHPTSSSIILYPTTGPIDNISTQFDSDYNKAMAIQHEKIRPYTRKWEASVMKTIDELNLVARKDSDTHHRCDVQHEVPAVVFSTGGYTGNLYHEFNDGILPLYITSQHLNKKVVFVILEYHNWWITKYGDVVSQLSDFAPIDFSGDKRIHCFPEAIVGLRIHDELAVDPVLTEGNKTVVDFHDLLGRAYWPRISNLIEDEKREREAQPNLAMAIDYQDLSKPKLVIISRNGSRSIMNEDSLVKTAEDIGFKVEVLWPQKTTELAKIYRTLNSSDVMVGVHGAALTHFLFMRPGSVFIQVVPLGTTWAAQTYYEEPATKLGLRYIGYKILPNESSLFEDYDEDDLVLMDPNSVNKKGWEFTKKIYLDQQNVRLELRRFGKRLLRAYYYSKARKNGRLLRQL